MTKSAFGKIILAAALVWAGFSSSALAQSSPGWTYGFVPTPAQWNAAFAAKQDFAGGASLPLSGGTMTGRLTTVASSAPASGFNLPQGVAPSAPNNGDLWTTAAGIFARINGVTYDLVGAPCLNCALTNAANVFTAAQTISLNASALPTAITGTTLRTAQVDGTINRIAVESYGAVISAFTVAHAAGTAAAPTQVLSGTEIGSFNAFAWGSNAAWNGPIATVQLFASENITGTAWGSRICLATSPIGSAAAVAGLCQNNDRGVTLGSPTGGLKGADTINAAGSIFINNVAVLTANQAISLTGDVTGGPSATSIATTLATAQPAVHTWALAQTFTVAPVFTDQSGSRTALGLGTAATQNTGTSGANVPLLNGANTWSAAQVISSGSLSVSGSDTNFNAGGNRAVMDFSSPNARVGSANGGGAAVGLQILVNGTSALNFSTAGVATFPNATTFSAAITYGGVTLSNSVTGTTSMVLAASPTFTGTPLSTTAAVDTNTTQIATTAFVLAQAAAATPLAPSGAGAVGTSTRYARADHVHPAASAYSMIPFIAGNLNPLVQASTFFFTNSAVATENVVAVPAGQVGTIDRLFCSSNGAPGGSAQTFTLTARKNAADQTLTCQMTTGGASTCSDVTHSFSVIATDLIDIKLVTSATSGTANGMNCSMRQAISSP